MSNEEHVTNIDIIDDDDNNEVRFENGNDKIQLKAKPKGSVGFTIPLESERNKKNSDSKVEPTIHDLSLYIDESQFNSAFSLNTPIDEKSGSNTKLFNGEEKDDSIYEVIFPIPEEKLVKNSNYIRTTKYTIWSFLPLNLLSQFRRLYNIYFLFGAFSTLTKYSALNPFTQIFPLLLVLSVTALKDGYEDYKRYLSDKETNNIKYSIFRNGYVDLIPSKDINCGDVVILQKGDKIPADLLLIGSSSEEGTCYIETSDLDGETNLKRRTALSQFSGIRSLDELLRVKCIIHCEQPNDNLASFDGSISIQISKKTNKIEEKEGVPFNMENMLLRGSILRNTDCIYGMVIYSGQNTKVYQNLKKSGMKFSKMEKKLNIFILYVFVFNIAILALTVIMNFKITKKEGDSYHLDKPDGNPYLEKPNKNYPAIIISSILSYYALYTYVIPISLFVSLEVVRFLQAFFMEKDKKMMVNKVEIKKLNMIVNNSNLNEELGVVEYIFSDKTGTLTRNDMQLSKWFIAGRMYERIPMQKSLLERFENPECSPEEQKMIREFCRAIAMCNETIPSFEPKTYEIIYESQSPDESALVYGIKTEGVSLIERNRTSISIGMWGSHMAPSLKHQVEETYSILMLFEFNSDRKRMSIILRRPNGKIVLYCKGADDIMFSRLSENSQVNDPKYIQDTRNALKVFSQDGLRVLLVATKELSEEEFDKFSNDYYQANQNINNRAVAVEEVVSEIEKDLKLLGATAIEDRLQDKVPETIDYILQSGIRFWLLTGDKQETAINIGTSSKLLSKDFNMMILNATTENECDQKLDNFIKTLKEIIVGVYDQNVMTSMQRKFLEIGTRCHSVICCRVTPIQKARVVKLVKIHLRKTTLAIGDGANDVSMIKAADVGIGIMGKEGAQAVKASDYAFKEFKFLKRLIFIHGHYNYIRITKILLYSFYKNIVLIIPQLICGFYTYWSGSIIYEEMFLTAYNVLLTSIPGPILACIERDLPTSAIYSNPKIYLETLKGKYWNVKLFLHWFLIAIYQGIMSFYMAYFTICDSILKGNGKSYVTGYWSQSYIIETVVLITVLVKAIMVTEWMTILTFLGIAIMLAFHLIIMITVNYLYYDNEGSIYMIFHSPLVILIVIYMLIVNLLPEIIITYYQKIIKPSHTQIVLETYKLKKNEPLNYDEDNSESDVESLDCSASSDSSSYKSTKDTEDSTIEPRISMSKD
ncbi:phospholipid-translocating P-type ATPase [Neocallimastix californiae]|uniref:Phospholipid-transporting ATPase n=1 Tax=Neocallimastix californiae TaxID=1754190 RepID=A0A1Y2DPB8_9FUNG|nr:phospholipid-translocating P-type ATPase [Neocallimastix californiae]|eukprot:ORY61131.1 phospholipid-translocating P-type ATPase [Neocallimastix californiae]